MKKKIYGESETFNTAVLEMFQDNFFTVNFLYNKKHSSGRGNLG